jgi:uncharacterized protein (TIGR00255 family)
MNSALKAQSMTGIGVSQAEYGSTRYRLILKSVNHRHFELRARLPRELLVHEMSIRREIQARVRRGSVELHVESTRTQQQHSTEWLLKLRQCLDSLQDFSFGEDARVQVAMKLVEKSQGTEETNLDLPWEWCRSAVDTATLALIESRLREGESLRSGLSTQCEFLKETLERLKPLIPRIREDWEQQFRLRVEKAASTLGTQVPSEDRILQELIFVAERRDVHEELERISAHLERLDSYLKTEGSSELDLGKKLDFLAQELHREWTTFGNKIQDLVAQRWANDARLSVDRIKELAANLA